MIIRADSFIRPVFHPEAAGYRSQLCKSKPLIKMPCVNVGFYNSVELNDFESNAFCVFHTVFYELFAYMHASERTAYRVACVAYVTAAPFVIGMKYI